MNKIGLIFLREYLTRVKKKSFIVMTILTPLLFGGMIFLVAWFSTKESESKVVEVLDKSEVFTNKLEDKDGLVFVHVGGELEEAKEGFKERGSFALLYIPKIDIEDPKGMELFSEQNPSLDLVSDINRQLENVIRENRIVAYDIDKALLDKLSAEVKIKTFNVSEGDQKESNAGVNFAVGYICSFLIYLFIFLYGAQVMRGVIEEKSNRIVEVIISSVKPFQLMLGKILGVASVGLTQFVIWIVLMLIIISTIGSFAELSEINTQPDIQIEGQVEAPPNPEFGSIMESTMNIPYLKILSFFLFYFLGGYLLYGALFAMIGSAVDSDADSQQFMMPITIPLLLSIISLASVLNDPNGQLAFWLSIIPLTSPVVMMGRLAFGVPEWQLALSVILLVGGFIFTTWFASRIYRVGILIHGTKVNYRVLMKWFFQK